MNLLDLPIDTIRLLLVSTTSKPVPLTNIDFYSNKLWALNGQNSYDKCKIIIAQIASHTEAVVEYRMVDIPGHGCYPIKDIAKISQVFEYVGKVEFIITITNKHDVSIHLALNKPYDNTLVGETNKQLLTYIRQDLIQTINSTQCTCSKVSLFT